MHRLQTTFVRVLTGEQVPDSGTVQLGDTIILGVYDQMGLKVDDREQTVLEFVLERVRSRESSPGVLAMGENLAPDEARRLLRKFEFPRQRWNDRISVLSGGECRRLQMLSVFSQRPNFLVMDEPSVDCDMDTLQALETFLREEYDGVLVIVSHDRSFADKVTDHLFVFQGEGQIVDFQGTLSEYASTLVELENNGLSGQCADDTIDLSDKKSSYKEDRALRNEQRNTVRKAKKDMDNLDKSLEKLRRDAAAIEKKIEESNGEGWSVIAELSEKLERIKQEIDNKEVKWMELAEVVETGGVEV